MLRLEITTQPARLALSMRMPQVEIDYHRPGLRIESTPPTLDISIEHPRIEMDATAPWAELGLKPSLHLAGELASAGQKAALDAIHNWASGGDELARIEQGTDIASFAAQRAWPTDNRQLNVDVAPKSRIEMTFHGGLEIDGQPGQLDIEIEEERALIALRPGAVKSYVSQKAAIDIRAVGERYSVIG